MYEFKKIWQPKISQYTVIRILAYLGSMLHSGLSIPHALSILLDVYKKKSIEFIFISHLINNITGGKSFSDSLMDLDSRLTTLQLSLIRIAESSNSMPVILQQISDDFSQTSAIKKRINKALIYPICIVVVCIVVLWVLLQFALPQISHMFIGANMQLPYLTYLILEIANVANKYGNKFILVLIVMWPCLYILINYLKKRTNIWLLWHKYLLAVPLVGTLYKYNFLINYASSLSITLGAGIPLLQSLSLSSKNYTHPVFKTFTGELCTKIGYGVGFYDAIVGYSFIPQYFKQMIKIAEETNDLPDMLLKAAAKYREDLEYAISSSLSWFEYGIVIIMGILVAVFVLAIYLPIFSLGSTLHI